MLSAKRLIKKHKDKSDDCKGSKEQQKASKRNKRRWRNCEYHFQINMKINENAQKIDKCLSYGCKKIYMVEFS